MPIKMTEAEYDRMVARIAELESREATWNMRHERETKLTDLANERIAALLKDRENDEVVRRTITATAERLASGLKLIAEMRGKTLLGGRGMESDRAYEAGANAAFGHAADIARAALSAETPSQTHARIVTETADAIAADLPGANDGK